MTHVFRVSNVNHAVARVVPWLLGCGIRETSRNGTVIVAPEPVITEYARPTERVLFSPTRDANPFFHVMESLWMLAGRNDVAFPVLFNKRFSAYSDDGETFHGAYGFRWRKAFGVDQLAAIAEELRARPDSRRCVLAMWDASAGTHFDENGMDDLLVALAGGKDVPCNTHAYFDARGGVLNMTVCCRSNDIIWGAYGANAVHFSFLQEYLAAAVGIPVGVYRQFSNNLHAYTDTYSEEKLKQIGKEAWAGRDHYTAADPKDRVPLVSSDVKSFDEDLAAFFHSPLSPRFWLNDFFPAVAIPMYRSWIDRKQKKNSGMGCVGQVEDPHWRRACAQWVERRIAA